MTNSVMQLEIDRLTVQERLELIGLLWDSLPESLEGVPVPRSHREELDRRLEAADANPEAGIPWEQVRERLRKRP